mgnify:CR=1 FL=1
MVYTTDWYLLLLLLVVSPTEEEAAQPQAGPATSAAPVEEPVNEATRVFGVPLEVALERGSDLSKSYFVPLVVLRCVQYLSNPGTRVVSLSLSLSLSLSVCVCVCLCHSLAYLLCLNDGYSVSEGDRNLSIIWQCKCHQQVQENF